MAERRKDIEERIANAKLKGHTATARYLETRQRNPDFTPREMEILVMLSEGHLTKQIAANLNVSKRTVDFLRADMLHKSGCMTPCQLMVWAMRKGLLT